MKILCVDPSTWPVKVLPSLFQGMCYLDIASQHAVDGHTWIGDNLAGKNALRIWPGQLLTSKPPTICIIYIHPIFWFWNLGGQQLVLQKHVYIDLYKIKTT